MDLIFFQERDKNRLSLSSLSELDCNSAMIGSVLSSFSRRVFQDFENGPMGNTLDSDLDVQSMEELKWCFTVLLQC